MIDSTELTKVNQPLANELDTGDSSIEDSIEVYRKTYGKDLTQPEFEVFKAVCLRTGLDPIRRQIYGLKRRQLENGVWVDRMSIQTGIDGYRLIAQRTGQRNGMTVQWCGEDGEWKEVWLGSKPPAAARVLIWRVGQNRPYPGIALFDEYAQKSKEGKLTGMWSKMPALMIAKCAEALALRTAFPAELSGLYTTEEMGNFKPEEESEEESKVERIKAETASSQEFNREAYERRIAESVDLEKLIVFRDKFDAYMSKYPLNEDELNALRDLLSARITELAQEERDNE